MLFQKKNVQSGQPYYGAMPVPWGPGHWPRAFFGTQGIALARKGPILALKCPIPCYAENVILCFFPGLLGSQGGSLEALAPPPPLGENSGAASALNNIQTAQSLKRKPNWYQ